MAPVRTPGQDGGCNQTHTTTNSLIINGEAGDDRIFGGDGNDTLDGGSETDQINGGSGIDTAVNGETVTNVP